MGVDASAGLACNVISLWNQCKKQNVTEKDADFSLPFFRCFLRWSHCWETERWALAPEEQLKQQNKHHPS